uniref:F-box domain-containing protein n=1 Tax=Meloidogyne enterolobii TaxID=390850 RepID=A0A6V7VXZ1_MELEN|nr:unnamed protein product [Meloidogyne enterolobii]
MNLPLETTLDVLKFLNFNQITSLKLTNSIFLCLIDEFEKVLPQMVFKQLSLISVSNDELMEYKCIEPKYLSLEITDQQRKNWIEIIEKSIPAFCCSEISSNEENVIIELKYSEEKTYYIAIKNLSETIEELNIIHYYWDQLFRCIFEFSEIISIVFNPKMITLLFNEKRYFYFKFISIDLLPLHNNILDLCRFATETLMVTKDLSFYFSSYYNFGNEMNILFNILINEGKRFTSINYIQIKSPLIERIIQV